MKKNIIIVTCLLVNAFIFGQTPTPVCFGVNVYTVQNQVNGTKASCKADFDNNGKMDVAIFEHGTISKIHCFLNSGTAAFTTISSAISTFSPSASYATSGDFNSDGKKDIAISNYNGNQVLILAGTGTGSFVLVNTINVATGNACHLCTGDFNNDTKDDIAVGTWIGSANITVLIGLGNGSFAPQVNYPVVSNPAFINTADYNADGNADLAITGGYGSNNVSILLGSNTGTFSNPVVFATGSSVPDHLVSADFNNDSKIDLAIANKNSADVSILLGLGNGSFSLTSTTFAFVYSTIDPYIYASDFNSDGKTDLVLANNSNLVTLFLGLGNGLFSSFPFSNTNFQGGINNVSVDDFNNDGKIDLFLNGFKNYLLLNNFTSIQGQASDPFGAVTGSVSLYQNKPNQKKYNLISTVTTNGSGFYNFPSVPSASYLVKAIPSDAGLQDTYNGDVGFWKNATLFNAVCGLTSTQNINVASLLNPNTGFCSISGTIKEGFGYVPKTSTPGNPIGGITVKGAKNTGGSVVGQTTTNSNGQYTLSALPVNASGEEYFVLVDLPGLDTSRTYHRRILTNTLKLTNLDFIVDSEFVRPSNINVGFDELLVLENAKLQVYPNPTSGRINIEFELKNAALLSIDVMDIFGRKVKTLLSPSQQAAGKISFIGQIDELQNGIYFVKIGVGEEERFVKIVLEE